MPTPSRISPSHAIGATGENNHPLGLNTVPRGRDRMSVRGRGFRVLAITVLVGLFALPEVPAAMAFSRVGSLTLNPGETGLYAAVIDSANGFAYFAADQRTVVKIRLSDFTRVGALTVNTGGNYLSSAVIDSVNGFAYFGTTGLPGAVVKIRLSDLTYVGSLTLNSGETGIGSAVIDSANGYAYFGTYSTSASLSVVVKVRLSDFARLGSLTLNPGESGLTSAVIDSASGFAYFGTNGSPGVVVKI